MAGAHPSPEATPVVGPPVPLYRDRWRAGPGRARNPRARPWRSFMPSKPLTLVIFGASGDLTARKLIPSLYNLDRKGRLPGELRVVGVARTPFGDDDFRGKLEPAAREFVKGGWDAGSWAAFA